MNSTKIINSFLILATITSLSSCSLNTHRPESINSKMSRFEPKDTHRNTTPSLAISAKHIKRLRTKRIPSSIHGDMDKSISAIPNKSLYFLTLLTQYNEFKKYTKSSSPKVTMCPNFHSNLVDFNNKVKNGIKTKKELFVQFPTTKDKINNQVKALYPELMLPLSYIRNTPTISDSLTSKTSKSDAKKSLVTAIDIHIIKTYKELNELCEYGSSTNYYNFENLAGHIQKSRKFGPTSNNISTLVKTPIFSNMALLKSLQSSAVNAQRSIASESFEYTSTKHTNEIIHRFKINWTKEYFKSIQKERRKLEYSNRK